MRSSIGVARCRPSTRCGVTGLQVAGGEVPPMLRTNGRPPLARSRLTWRVPRAADADAGQRARCLPSPRVAGYRSRAPRVMSVIDDHRALRAHTMPDLYGARSRRPGVARRTDRRLGERSSGAATSLSTPSEWAGEVAVWIFAAFRW